MAYERINWQNEPSEATALNDVNLNKMDSAIYELDGKATTTDTAITNLQNGKVDKVTGKGLSQVDNVTVTQHVAYGTVVSTIKTYKQDGTEVTSQVCNGIVVDSALSDSSTNPVQNKVVKSAIDGKSTVAISDTLATGTTLANITIDGTTTAIKGSDIEVDEELSPTSANPVENKAIYDALNNLLPSKTVSGNPITISDASGFNAKALTVTMNPIQDLHGYDNPWVGGAGKNKLNLQTRASTTVSGITSEIKEDNRIIASGTSTGNGDITCPVDSPFTMTAGNAYTISINGTDTRTGSIVIFFGTSYINAGSISADAHSLTFTPSVDVNCNQVMFRSSIGRTITIDANIQIEEGSTATSYAPYSNICPISGRTEASVKRTGKNEIDEDFLLLANGWTKSGGEYSGLNSALHSAFSGGYSGDVKFHENTQYTASFDFKANENKITVFGFKYSDGTKSEAYLTNTTYERKNFTSTINKTVVGILFSYGGNTTVHIKEFQLEQGSTATTYEPYTAETKTHQYGQTVYGGEDDFVNGGATSTMAMVDLGTLTYGKSSLFGNTFFYASTKEIGSPVKPLFYVLSSQYTSTTGDWTEDCTIKGYGNPAYYFSRIGIRDDAKAEMSTSEFKAAMDGVQLCYELATPATIQTSAEDISLLKGNNVLSTNADDIELKYSVSLDSLLPTTTRTLAKSIAPIEEEPIVEEPKEETEEQR